ncbi:MAG: hypothetical protein LAP85_13675 [Acidobacteriia bacterium]|nr:hypothetical protein [Terriglobia bacterium]
MQTSHVRPYQKWNWAGDEIVHDTVIPASRTLPGGKRKHYPIDLREFLSIEDNAVVRKHLEMLIDELPGPARAGFFSRESGTFDLRLAKVAAYMSRFHYRWSPRRFDQWLFPEETLALGGGDCEDLAFLLAALLEASGISPYCLRVALGTVVNHTGPQKTERWDHAWVIYQNEGGAWELLEPVALVHEGRRAHPSRPARPIRLRQKHPDVEYVPHFVFNRNHVWRLHAAESAAARTLTDYVGTRKDREFWQSYKPRFAAKVHWSIFDEALAGMPDDDLERVKRASLWVDTDVLRYDPRDHFDFAYIDAAWDRVRRRLATGDLTDFALAAHAIGDFYAHSFYADFAPAQGDGSIEPFDPMHPPPPDQLVYDFQSFIPLPGCQSTPGQAAAHWKGSLISGQWWRWFTTFPDDLETSPDFSWHRCLPDHDMVAVDGPNPKPEQRHYAGNEYLRQFNLRRNAAIEHIRSVYASWPARADGGSQSQNRR